jgi:16S rRNA G966 N2-methylase RsmD
VTFVDRSRHALACLRENLAALGFGERARCLQRPLPDRLERLPERPFALIFSDPAYAEDWRELIPRLSRSLLDHGAVCDETVWCHELSARAARGSEVEAPPGWELVDSRRYGDTALWLFEPG